MSKCQRTSLGPILLYKISLDSTQLLIIHYLMANAIAYHIIFNSPIPSIKKKPWLLCMPVWFINRQLCLFKKSPSIITSVYLHHH